MIYIKLSEPVLTLKSKLNVKFNYQKDEWFVKITNINELEELKHALIFHNFIGLEGVNMSEDELYNIKELILNIYKSI